MKFTKIKRFLAKIPLLVRLHTMLLTGTFFIGTLPQYRKIETLLEYAQKFNCKIFVETGTYRGDTVSACKDFFDELFSIELSHELFLYSKNRFSNNNKIHLFEGDSGSLLPKIIAGKNKPILFWLDAHYSGGETAQGEKDFPIVKELDFILANVHDFCILIDDARCFRGKDGYPTIRFLKKMIKNINQKNSKNILELRVKNDIIRITKI